MEKWVCKRCGREVFEKPKKNAICNKDGCKGRYQHYVKCKDCGKWFYNFKNYRTRCDDCSYTAKHERSAQVDLICDNCGKKFKRFKGNIKAIHNNYCSRECMLEHRKGEKLKRVCKNCGKEFEIYKSWIAKTNASGNYCCWQCYSEAQTLDKERVYTGFAKAKRKHFNKKQFCAICGTTKKIHIHHIMPNRISHDQNKENLIPLCASCHPKIERVTRDFLKAFDGEYEKAEPLLRMILRQRQYATSLVIKEILNGNSKNKD